MASMSCVFCPTAFCSEHHVGNIRLTQYYQLACLKHDDVEICDDPAVLKIFGLCKTPKTSSSSRKDQRRKSADSGKKVRRDKGTDLGEEGRTKSARHHRKFLEIEPRERGLKRSCRDQDVKKKEGDWSLLKDSISHSTSDTKWNIKEKEQDRHRKRREFESEQKRQRSTEGGDSGLSLSLEDQSRAKKRQKQTHKPDVNPEALKKKTKKNMSGESSTFSQSRCRTSEPDSDHSRLQKRQRMQYTELAEQNAASSLDYFPSTASLSSELSKDLSGAAAMGMWTEVKPLAKSPIMSTKSFLDEPLFDSSDDDLPDLVIDVPTI